MPRQDRHTAQGTLIEAQLNAEDYRRLADAPRHKYRAIATEVDGIRFASKAEARRYGELKLMERAGEICRLTVHPVFDLVVYDVRIGRYTADFSYWVGDVSDVANFAVEDVKGGRATRTEAYRLRKRLVKALYGIDIQEIE